jgi:molecular chaperone GrpE
MNPNEQIPKPEQALDEIDLESDASVDDFIKELEAKEKDLHITADYTIELAELDFDPEIVPEFAHQEVVPALVESAAPAAKDKPKQSAKSQTSTKSKQGEKREPGMKTRVFELENEIESLSSRIVELRSERNEIQDKSDQRLKDFENYKYRMDRERRGSFIDQIANLAFQLLPVLDNLDRALDSVESSGSEKNAEFEQFFDGIVLVNQQVNEVLAEMGVQPIMTKGEAFDPHFHEAVATEEREDLPHNTISGELLRGWRIGNKVIRHSMVKVTQSAQQKKAGKTEEPVAPIPEPFDLLPDPADAPSAE